MVGPSCKCFFPLFSFSSLLNLFTTHTAADQRPSAKMLWFNKDPVDINDAKDSSEINEKDAGNGSDLGQTQTQRSHAKYFRGEEVVTTDEQRQALDNEQITEGAQLGVQKMEAITSSWTKRDLIIAYVL